MADRDAEITGEPGHLQRHLQLPTSRHRPVLSRVHSAPLTVTKTHGANESASHSRPQTPLNASSLSSSSSSSSSSPSSSLSPSLSPKSDNYHKLLIIAPAFAPAPAACLDSDGNPQPTTHHQHQGQVQNQPPEVYIVVVGAARVGKSTFVQQALSLDSLPTSALTSRSVSLGGLTVVLRMLECQLADLTVNGDNRINWPLDERVPRIDAALTLYDVTNKDTFDQVPVILNALEKASVPSVLVSCKCDIDLLQRQIDPDNVEQRAKSILRNLDTLQTSTLHADSPAKGVATLLRAVSAQRYPAPCRRKTIAHALQTVSSRSNLRSNLRPPHKRASSEISTMMRRNDTYDDRHDSTTASVSLHKPLDFALHPDGSLDAASDSSMSRRPSSSDEEAHLDVDTQSEAPSDERGYSLDNLVDRLLRLPRSKADHRFNAVFLALYRKFAAPGQLLEAIVHRFETLDTDGVPFMTKTVSQLRYLSVIEQWIGTYPGDFAHPKTRRRMRVFVAKLSNTRIFCAAAREMTADLEMVDIDDDTNWACCDRDRERRGLDHTIAMSSRVSTLLDDASFEFGDNLGSLSLGGDDHRESTHDLHTDFGLLQAVDAARRQAQSLVPSPKLPIGKMHWRMLMETPTDTIASELTRIDWVMFSAMRPRDLVRHVSLSQSQKATCRSLIHVSRMIDHFNHIRDWVANFILLREKAKHRVLILEKFMHVARRLREMNNYNSLGAFLAGISSAAVHRLIATREMLPPDTVKDWMKLEILMSPTRSYSAYRLAWENSSGERIPFLPLPIRDLVAAEEGNKTYIGEEADGRINWRKFEVMGDTVVGIQKAQGLPYRSSILGPRKDELRSLILNNNTIGDDEALYERSCNLESTGNDRRTLREFFKRQ